MPSQTFHSGVIKSKQYYYAKYECFALDVLICLIWNNITGYNDIERK